MSTSPVTLSKTEIALVESVVLTSEFAMRTSDNKPNGGNFELVYDSNAGRETR